MSQSAPWSSVDLDLQSYLSLQNTPYEGRGSSIELAEVPKSRAPSYTSRHSVFRADDDADPLIKEGGAIPSWGRTKSFVSSRVRSGDFGRSPTTVSKEKKRRLSGWRFGVALSASLASLVLLINVLFVIIGSALTVVKGGIGTLFEGDCHYVESTAVWLHVAINILGTLLLSASNYTMQALCSPTRAEVDKAHAKGDWVDIGVPSVRNIRGRIARRRIAMWWILGLSSVPIHLLYNSAIFKTIDANSYNPMLVNSRFLEPGRLNESIKEMGFEFYNDYYNDEFKKAQSFFIDNIDDQHQVAKLSPSECMSVYGANFVSGYSDVLIVTNDLGTNESKAIFWAEGRMMNPAMDPGNWWICYDIPEARDDNTGICDIAKAKRSADQWSIQSHRIDHCLLHLLPGHCKLQFSQAILITVILMNASKAAVMLWVLYRQKSSTLVTVGDAIASFLSDPDPLTTSRCLMAHGDVYTGPLRWRPSLSEQDLSKTEPLPKTFRGQHRQSWARAASVSSWLTTLGLFAIALAAVAVLLSLGTQAGDKLSSAAQAFSLGFGKIDARLLIPTTLPKKGAAGLMASVLLANTPQAICSFIYLAYNGLFTAMMLAHEWSGYYLRPKALRVTTPHGQQRSKYYLQLPFKYSVPLLATSALLHWLISESIFLARVDMYRNGDEDDSGSFSQTGYSPLPILLVILVGSCMLLTLVGLGFRKLQSPMPVVGSCSVAIAAACHRPKDDEDAAYLPVAWGDVNTEGFGEIGHCTFTSQSVYEPVEGRMYAGLDSTQGGVQVVRRRAAADTPRSSDCGAQPELHP